MCVDLGTGTPLVPKWRGPLPCDAARAMSQENVEVVKAALAAWNTGATTLEGKDVPFPALHPKMRRVIDSTHTTSIRSDMPRSRRIWALEAGQRPIPGIRILAM
jgi:hypothetical protein